MVPGSSVRVLQDVLLSQWVRWPATQDGVAEAGVSESRRPATYDTEHNGMTVRRVRRCSGRCWRSAALSVARTTTTKDSTPASSLPASAFRRLLYTDLVDRSIETTRCVSQPIGTITSDSYHNDAALQNQVN